MDRQLRKNNWKQWIMLFLALILFYYLFLTLAFMVPDEWIVENHQESMHIIQEMEEERWQVMTGLNGSQLDTFTDRLIFNNLLNKEDRPFYQASLWVEGRYRYWLGTIAPVRILLIFMNYAGIRYINLFFMGLVTFITFYLMNQKLGLTPSLLYMVSMLLIHAWIFPLSLQYSPIYYIWSFMMIYLLAQKDPINPYQAGLVFFIGGSVTNYFDLLTAPLLTYALPVLILLVINNQERLQTFGRNLKTVITTGLSWLLAYSFTWLSKWVLAFVFIRDDDVLHSIFEASTFRSGTIENVSYMNVIRRLIGTLIPNYAYTILLILLVVLLVFVIKKKIDWRRMVHLLPIFFVGALPFIWAYVFQNHCYHHSYFVYRIFITTFLSLFLYLFQCLSVKDNDDYSRQLHASNRDAHSIST